MITDQKELEERRKLLREPFAKNLISKLPKETKAQKDARLANSNVAIRCAVCDGWHHRDAIHLDYVGHAAITDRLLAVDPEWHWEPMAYRDGLPQFDETGGLWIKLTVLGVTRLGYGHAMAKPFGEPGNREKEVIGDALRNAGMRFGMGVDLWHKGGSMHDDDQGGPPPAPTPPQAPAAGPKKKATPKGEAPPDPAPNGQAEAKLPKLEAVIEAFWAAKTEAGLTEAGKLAERLGSRDLQTARKEYGLRLRDLRRRASLLQQIKPVLKDDDKLAALVNFCGAELGVLLSRPEDLERVDTEDLVAIGEWLGNKPEQEVV